MRLKRNIFRLFLITKITKMNRNLNKSCLQIVMRQDFLIMRKAPLTSIDIYGNTYLIDDLSQYINDLAIFYGSDLRGRNLAMAKITGIKYKLPLLISNKAKIYYLKTRNLMAEDCVLINYYWFDHYKALKNMTELYFRNGYKIVIDVDYRIIKRQVAIIQKYLNIYECSVV